jgi:2-C-methyl-D-erythritol 2,4-cyclodiphosphate synthase
LKARVGLGYDIHRLVRGRRLYLGGVELDFPKGCLAHSDGDCLIHAVIDALLGALGEGDIGRLFPDTDPRTEGVRSTELLKAVVLRLKERGASIVNIDAVIIAQAPNLAPDLERIRGSLAGLLGLAVEDVGLQAKTNEGLGPVGRGRAIACWAAALVNG